MQSHLVTRTGCSRAVLYVGREHHPVLAMLMNGVPLSVAGCNA